MLGFIHVAVAVLSFLSVGQTAPVTSCETLIQPLKINGREQLEGKWLHVAESVDRLEAELVNTKFRDSYWIKFTAANESDAVIYNPSLKGFGVCVSSMVKMILKNNTLHPTNASLNNFDKAAPLITMTLLETSCSDCLLIYLQSQITRENKMTSLLLLSKTRSATTDHLRELKKQAKCLKLRPPYSLKPDEELCPELPSQDTEDLDFRRIFLNGQMMIKKT